MQVRMVIFVLLSVAAWILLNNYYATQAPPAPEETPAVQASAAAAPTGGGATAPAEKMTGGARIKGEGGDAEERLITVSTDLYRAVFSSRGGKLVSFKINRYIDAASGQIEDLTTPGSRAAYLTLLGRELDDSAINYRVEGAERLAIAKGESKKLTFRHESKGQVLTKEYIFHGGRYAVDIEVELGGRARTVNEVTINWGPDLGKVTAATRYGDIMRVVTLAARRLTEKTLKGKEAFAVSGAAADWVALKKRYFTVILRSDATKYYEAGYVPAAADGTAAQEHIGLASAIMPDGAVGKARFCAYLGPLDYYTMKSEGHDMQRALTFGTFNLLGELMLRTLHYLYGHVRNWGVAIILLSVLIKALLWWPTQKSQVATRRMQTAMKVVQPQLNALKKKYKDDPQRLNQEQMELFRQHKINPMGGCLPMLMQMPVFWALYTTLVNAIELRRAPFLWINDLASGDPLFILPALMGLTGLMQQRFSSTTDTTSTQQKMMMYFFPIFLGVISVYWPSGLLLYWVVSNILFIGQAHLVNKSLAGSGQQG